MLYIILLIVMTFIGAFAGYNLKKASSANGIKGLILEKNFYIGGFLYFLSALMNIYILKYLDYTMVLPLTAITYIWTLLISFYFLHEIVSIKKVIGIFAILLGAVCIVI
jgi:drug/metabolite transporter (DMT)-like permease